MRLIPGQTKVQIEIFKGVTLWDLLVGAIQLIILALIFSSSLPFKPVFIAFVLVMAVLLIARMDNQPNYMYLLYIIRHFAFRRRFNRLDNDKVLVDYAERGKTEVAFDSIFGEENSEKEENLEDVQPAETKAERKKRLKAEKAERKADDKLLKSKKLSKEEEDAIWLKRANQAAADKQKKKEKAKASKKSADKWGDMEDLSSFSGISDGFIDFHGKYYGAAIEIPAIEFRFFSEYRRDNSIENALGAVLRSIKPEYSCNILKIERPINYANYEELEYKKVDSLKKSFENGFLTEEELKARLAIVYDRITQIQNLMTDQRVVVPFYYLILFDSNKAQLDNEVSNAIDSLKIGEMNGKRLDDKELALMLKYSNALDFNEQEIDRINPEDYAKWAMPNEVEFYPRISVVDGIATHNFRVSSFPSAVGDAWLASVMTYPSTKVMIKIKPMDSGKAIRAIDKSLSELRGTVYNAKTDSQALEAQTHLETLEMLLSTLQSDNEQLLNVNVYVTAYDYVYTEKNPKLTAPEITFRDRVADMKKVVRRLWSEDGFRLNNNEFNQAMAYIGSQVSGYDPMEIQGRGMPSNTVAAIFPWIFPYIMDRDGVQIGSADGVPVFVDFFERNNERVNSNMVIIGKSGSGKSYATKSLLCNLAADDAKIFVLDPEDEYTTLAANVHGKIINVATNQYGRLNPFHIITNLEDETDLSASTGYSTHLQFLEEFFKQILPDCDRDSLEYLNTLLDRTYKRKGIDPDTDLTTLRPEDFPIFDDLYDEILMEFQKTQNDYLKTMLRTLMNYISKFSEGGRNSVIWNGPSTITTQENFTVFDFQTLLANRNTTIANAQMLLVLKYIDNEISKNRDYNEKFGLNRKIVVVIDEAHVFIDSKYPVALDFMFQLAKRIRKYNGMQIVITQNIKDFVGSEEIARKSTAIINASQYSFIFALSPNDMDDLCKLYEKAGGINETEQEQMIQAPRGQAFTIMSPVSRTSFRVVAPDDTRDMFSDADFVNPYFFGEKGQDAWEDVLGNSAKLREEALEKRNKDKKTDELDEALEKLGISFAEFTEEEFEAEKLSLEAETNKDKAVEFEEEPDYDNLLSGSDYSESDMETSIFKDVDEPEIDFGAIFGTEPESLEEIPVASASAKPSVPTVQAAQPVIIQQSGSRTEEILASLVDRLSTDSIIDEIKRLVKEEVESKLEGENVPARQRTEESKAFDYTKASDYEDEPEESTSFDISDIFGSTDTDDTSSADGEDEDSSSGSVAVGNLFDFADIYEDDDEDDDAEDSTIDIVALLSNDINKAVESDNFIENFISGSEKTTEVTVEQLIAYTKKLRMKEAENNQ